MIKSLIDTNILVYRDDPRDPFKQDVAKEVLYKHAQDQSAYVAHQALVETYSALTKPQSDLGGKPLLSGVEAGWVVKSVMREFPVLWPTYDVVKVAMDGKITHQLAWYDAHMWAYASVHGLPELLSEDFEHGRHYDEVRVVDPFLSALGGVHELPPMYETGTARS